MRRTAGALSVLLGVAIAIAVATPAIRSALAPRSSEDLVCDKPVHDFGSMTLEEGANRSHTFVLRNNSRRAVKIGKIEETCGCTSTSTTSQTVPPGGSTEIRAAIDWSAKPGQQEVQLDVQTSSPKNPHVLLYIRGFVKVPAILSPAILGFGVVAPGKQETRFVELVPGTDPRLFRILKVDIPAQWVEMLRVDADGRPTGQPLQGDPGRFRIVVMAPKTYGKEQAKIVFHTDLPRYPERVLTVSAEFAGSIEVVPTAVLFQGDLTQKIVRQVRVSSVRGGKPGVEIVASTPDMYSIEGIEAATPSGDIWTVTIACRGKEAKPAIARSVLRITIGAEQRDISMIAVPVSRT
jgi:hypothetical protein